MEPCACCYGAPMALRQQLLGRAIQAYLGTGFVSLRQRMSSLRAGDALEFYHQVDDPYSELLLQLVPKLVNEAGLALELVIVPPPAAEADPQPQLRRAYALRDAHELARRYQLSFPAHAEQPTERAVSLANSILLREREPASQLFVAEAVGDALFQGDMSELEAQRDRCGAIPREGVAVALGRGAALRRKRGHYSGGMLRYRGIWYWGVDRLHHLEAQLRRMGRAVVHGLVAREIPELAPAAEHANELLMYHSFRSPYSYIVLERAAALAARHGATLDVRPVLPMVMRGLQVPRAKRMYIVRDVAREARSMNVPFGRICDPLGVGIERCFALFALAQRDQRGFDFALSAGRGIWSEALDVARDDDLQRIAERAGLNWSEAKAALSDPEREWRGMAERHREELNALGLWGVPSFRFGDYAVWGQDRLDSLDERMAAAEAHRA
jgi:2-hydroxychromene-2-carboxylate isomerase